MSSCSRRAIGGSSGISQLMGCLVLLLSASLLMRSETRAQGAPATAMSNDPCAAAPRNTAALDRASQALITPVEPTSGASLPSPPATDEARQKARAEQNARDWPDLCHYASDNGALAVRPRVVFMGDSITEFWKLGDPGLFSSGVLDRGISGQTSPQMLARFYADVIALKPQVVHIMAGTNDIAGNTGPTSEQAYRDNIMAMAELARAHGIRVVVASVPPTARFGWAPRYRPAEQVRALNAWLRAYARHNHFGFVDYYSVLATPDGGFDPKLSNDGVHPNANGYAAMRPLALKATARAVRP